MFWSRRTRKAADVATRLTASSSSSWSSNPGSGFDSRSGSRSTSGLGATAPHMPTGPSTLAPRTPELVRRHLTRENARGLEILGHAIEYLADEYAFDAENKGPWGNADPRIEAIQLLKGLNRSIYFSGTEIQPPLQRIRRWLTGEKTA
jgi:hypothetical protein